VIHRVKRTDEQLRELDKPKLETVPTGFAVSEQDVLIMCAGFEDRAVHFLRSAVESGSRGFRVLAFDYLPSLPENRLAEALALSDSAGAAVVEVTYDRASPSGAGQRMMEALQDVGGRIFLDISGMSRLLIVQALVALAESSAALSRTSVLYAEAADYPPSEGDVAKALCEAGPGNLHEAVFLSSGVFGITIVPELSTVAMQGQALRIIAFPSFNVQQLLALRIELQPSHFVLIHGVPHLAENAWRPSAIEGLNRTSEIRPRDDFRTSTLDYRETLERLLLIYDQYGESEQLVVAPTGSKMQAVAVGLFRAFMQDIQIVYPTPRVFTRPERYTRGVLAGWLLKLDTFGGLRYGSTSGSW